MKDIHFTCSVYRLLIISCCCLSPVALAADAVAEISGLEAPLQLGQLVPFSVDNIAVDKDLCVYSSTGAYTVTIWGNGPAQGFTATLPNTKPIDYQVFWNNAQGLAGNFQLLAGQPSPVQTQTGNSNCTTVSGNPGYWVNLQTIIPDAQLQGAYAGSYAPNLQINILAVEG